jgi:hypothetical protein
MGDMMMTMALVVLLPLLLPWLQVYLERLREERGQAQGVMAQHSQWLQGFREHVSSVATLLKSNSSSSVGASTSHGAQLHAMNSAGGTVGQRAVVGGPLSPVASSSLLAPRLSAQPMTLDLGNQQLVISLVHKTA